MDPLLATALSVILGYLLGAIPTGTIVARGRGVDLTRTGSGRTGATNVLRTLGAGAAALVFLGDLVKGAAAVLLARALGDGAPWPQAVAATAAVVGHSYSPFIGWRGGRGVVPGTGGLLVIWFPAALAAAIVALLTIALTRYVSLGSIVGTLISAVMIVGLVVVGGQPSAYVFYGLAAPLFIIVSHRDNIARLREGTERKLGEKA